MLVHTTALLLQLLSVTTPADAKLLKDARKAQTRFESFRRMNLPREFRSGTPDRCDALVGRYCYWFDGGQSRVERESPKIAEEREKLLHFLDSAAARNRGEPWLYGQRIRYLLDAKRPSDALAVARACDATRWWCAALLGLTLHVTEQYVAADSAFAEALREMPAKQQCEWLDLHEVVVQRLEKEMKRAPCAERPQIAERLWLLSKPLWSTPGNDLRTEHFARLTMAAILAKSANTQGLAWSHDSRELLVRYGWPEWFTRRETRSSGVYSSSASPSVVITGHDREPSFQFFPDIASLTPLPRLTPESWAPRLPPGRSRYAPRHIRGLSTPRHQLVRFPRGDSMIVAVAFALGDETLASDSLTSYLFAYQRGELQPNQQKSGTGPLWGIIANDTSIVSIEVRGDMTRHAARARYTLDPLPRVGTSVLSDLLLFDPTGTTEGSDVSVLLPKASTEPRLSATSPLGVYWELESVPIPGPVWYSLTVEPKRAGVVRRLAIKLRLAPEPAPVRLRWQGVIQHPLEQQSVTLRLPEKARGKYRVLLTIEPPNAPPVSSARDIELDR